MLIRLRYLLCRTFVIVLMGIVTLYTTFRLNHHSQNLSRRRKSTVGLESVARYDIIVKTFVYKSLLHKSLIQNANDHLQSKMPFKKSAKKATNEPAEAIPSTVVETGEKKKRETMHPEF